MGQREGASTREPPFGWLLWACRASLLALLAATILLDIPVSAAILVVTWIWAEVTRLRKLRTRPGG
jgi:hypothetical protein